MKIFKVEMRVSLKVYGKKRRDVRYTNLLVLAQSAEQAWRKSKAFCLNKKQWDDKPTSAKLVELQTVGTVDIP